MFGASWLTTLFGYVVIVLTVVQQAVVEQGLPADVAGWIKFAGGIVTGVGIALAKDFNKTNATSPDPVAHPAK
jgi:mannose/fructose/N-acetylgalactosamine-specific phosphotransferase system component IIC